ncbi:hypothetical protein [Anabaena azotica]|uniref:hypothetical protein n=1 Tax=Anabaena azotica TaxID=197653 RepID=UPI0039A57387
MQQVKTTDKIIFWLAVIVPVTQATFFLISGGFQIGSQLDKIKGELTLINYRLSILEKK